MLSLSEALVTPVFPLLSFSAAPVHSRCITNPRKTRNPLASCSRPSEVLVVKLLSNRIRVVTTSSRSLVSATPTTRKSHSMGQASTKLSTLSLLRTSPPERIHPLVGPEGSLVAAVEVTWMFLSISRYAFTVSATPHKTYSIRRVPGLGTSMCKLLALKVLNYCRRRTSPTRGTLSVFPYLRILTAMVALSRSFWVRSCLILILTATHFQFSEHRGRVRLQTFLNCS